MKSRFRSARSDAVAAAMHVVAIALIAGHAQTVT